MQIIGRPKEIRILEIFANQEAYKSHLQTSHFKFYKKNTLHMVKSLNLIDMKSIDPEMMVAILIRDCNLFIDTV